MHCSDCTDNVQAGANFCTVCGKSLTETSFRIDKNLWSGISYFFAILLMGIIGAWIIEDEYDFAAEIVTSLAFVLITTLYVVYFQKYINPYLHFRWRIKTVLGFAVLATVAAVLVTGVADYLNKSLYDEYYSEIYIYFETQYPLLFATLFTCFVPAVFEEMAFRGFIYKIVEDYSSTQSALIVSSILFAILHLSLIGLLWYIPLGFAAGYVRMKYKSLTYCMLLHFVYNFTIVLLEYYQY